MRSVVLTATLFTTLWLAAPGRAAAQDPEAAPPPPPRQVAVPRAERAERRRAREAEPTRPTRRPAKRDESPGGQRPTAAMASEEQGAQRRGAVRRPPSGGGGRWWPGSQRRRGPRRLAGRRHRRSSARTERRREQQRPRRIRRRLWQPRSRRAALERAGTVDASTSTRAITATTTTRYYDPWGYGAFGLGYVTAAWGLGPLLRSPGYYAGYGGGYGDGYGYQYADYDIGSVKIKVKPRDAEVYVDNYFAGYVDDFDGIFQSLKVETGGHRIEVRKPGFETLQFDVHVQPSRSVTFRGDMKPTPEEVPPFRTRNPGPQTRSKWRPW